METTVHFTPGGYVPSMGGIGGFVWQSEVYTIPTHTGSRIAVIDGVSTIGTANVDEDLPAELRNDHEAIAAFWQAQVTSWAVRDAQDAAELEAEARGEFVVDGHAVSAPGFTSVEQLEAFVSRAKTAQLRTWPAQGGAVLVSSRRETGGRYTVTRTSCECQGHQSHGRCLHRALALWLVDVDGVNLCRVTTIGVNGAGRPMTAGPKPAAEAA